MWSRRFRLLLRVSTAILAQQDELILMSSAPNPLVSFVIPCYNYGRFLSDCLNSIFIQEGNYNFEIIAVDDASTDDTLEVLERFRDPRLRVMRHERNKGHVKTVNEGLAAARGE